MCTARLSHISLSGQEECRLQYGQLNVVENAQRWKERSRGLRSPYEVGGILKPEPSVGRAIAGNKRG